MGACSRTAGPRADSAVEVPKDVELAAIALAQELKADLLLIDEARGRKAAADRHIPFTGTIGVLELADQGLLDIVRLRKVEQEVLDLIDEPTSR